MRTVGNREWPELERDPQRAFERGQRLDDMLRGTLPPRPRGVFRMTHAQMNAEDDRRMVELARRLLASKIG